MSSKINTQKCRSKIVFIFLDGFGLGSENNQNPLFSNQPFRDYLSENVVQGVYKSSNKLIVKGIDACLDVKGIPQSATGQTALFTGINASQLLGYHLPAFPNETLMTVIRKSNIFMETINLGLQSTFANAYRNEFFESVNNGNILHSVTTTACLAASIQLRTLEQYNKSQAVFWDITGQFTKAHTRDRIIERTPEEAGAIIAAMAAEYHLTVFESFLPDLIGHSCDLKQAEQFCLVLKHFLAAIINNIDKYTTVVITSDHGNFEDLSTGSHTTNPVLLFAYGADAQDFCAINSIVDISKVMISILGKNKN